MSEGSDVSGLSSSSSSKNKFTFRLGLETKCNAKRETENYSLNDISSLGKSRFFASR